VRRGLSLMSLAILAACEEPQPLFSAACNDGTRVAGTRDVVESRCARRRGISSLTPLDEVKEPPEARP